MDAWLTFLHHTAQVIDASPLPQAKADSNAIKAVTQIVLAILGGISVIMVIIGGIKYAGSQGDPAGTAKAKNTIIYALVGVLVALLATTIVQFTVGRTLQ